MFPRDRLHVSRYRFTQWKSSLSIYGNSEITQSVPQHPAVEHRPRCGDAVDSRVALRDELGESWIVIPDMWCSWLCRYGFQFLVDRVS